MSDLFLTTPFDILIKDFFNSQGSFLPVHQAKYSHPVDIYEDSTGLHIEVACTGINKEDIHASVSSGLLKIVHTKNDDDEEGRKYHHRTISRRAFDLGIKIASKFDLGLATPTYKNGLLIIDIPFAESSKPRTLKIK